MTLNSSRSSFFSEPNQIPRPPQIQPLNAEFSVPRLALPPAVVLPVVPPETEANQRLRGQRLVRTLFSLTQPEVLSDELSEADKDEDNDNPSDAYLFR